MIRDHLEDTGLQLLHTLQKQFLTELPDIVKAADIPNERPDAKAPSSAYADPVRRKFPCHTKAATLLSNLYYWGQKANDECWEASYPQARMESRLEKAAKYWGIYAEVDQIRCNMIKESSAPQRALTDSDFALVINYGTERVRRFPIVNSATVKKAAANLRRSRVSYPYTWRKRAARNILKKAMEFSTLLDLKDLDYAVKAAGIYPKATQELSQQLKARALVFPDDIKVRLQKAADLLAHNKAIGIDKLCNLIDEADRQYKQYPMYNAGMPMPEDLCFDGLSAKTAAKMAAKDENVQLTTGTFFKLADIAAVGLAPFTVLGDSYAGAVAKNDKGDIDITKLSAILPTMPRDDAALLEQALKAVGVKPCANEKQANRPVEDEFSIDALTKLLGKLDMDFSGSVALGHPQDTRAGNKTKDQ